MKVYLATDRNAFQKTVERFSNSFFVKVVKKKTNSVHLRYNDEKEFDVLILHSQSFRNKNLRGKTIDVLIQSTSCRNPELIAWARLNFPSVMVHMV